MYGDKNYKNEQFNYDHMCDKCKYMIQYKHHMCCGEDGGECACHEKSLWGTEKETFSQFTKEMLYMIERDTTEADIQSEEDLLK